MFEKFKQGFGFTAGLLIGYSLVKGLLKGVKELDEKEDMVDWLKVHEPEIYIKCKEAVK